MYVKYQQTFQKQGAAMFGRVRIRSRASVTYEMLARQRQWQTTRKIYLKKPIYPLSSTGLKVLKRIICVFYIKMYTTDGLVLTFAVI